MASFCENCGAPLDGAFCGKCGAKAGTAQAAAPQNIQAAPAAPAKGSNTVVKVVLGVFGVLVLLGIVAAAGLYWAASKVKDKVQEAAQERGIDFKQLASEQSAATSTGGDGCWLLPREEAEKLAGFPLLRAAPKPDADPSKLTCQYFADPAVLSKSAQAQADDALKALKSSKGSNEAADMQQIEKFTKGLMAGAGGGGEGNGLVFELEVRRGGGRSDWAGVSMASGAMGGMQKLQGLGDQALAAPMGIAIYALKGDNFLELTLGALPGGRQKGVEIARSILGRL